MRQLALGVQLRVALRLSNFHAGANREALAALEALLGPATRAPLWLYGAAGAGKTHLLQAACAEAGERGMTAAYLPVAGPPAEAALLAGFEGTDLVALDGVDRAAGDGGWERALFTLYHGLQERSGRLLLAADGPPVAVPFRLADLASRLSASQVHRLQPLSEPEQAEALARRAAVRGLELPPETVTFLMRRVPRDFSALCRMLDELDSESLAAQRRLTVPFVRDWLARGGRPRPA